ncbi:hypothetical protein [Mycobacterium simiae]|uniref:hypothetical protein n=1 Tax=Mycobacterium simiae TaxID=1784 RepID=UPI002605F64D|nr:hypothetical protein [Mycobacterium simiae]
MTTRPYPNVRRADSKAVRWEAVRPNGGKAEYLGTFATPEAARRAVLIAQALHLEAKASKYRAEADALAGDDAARQAETPT